MQRETRVQQHLEKFLNYIEKFHELLRNNVAHLFS